MRKTLLAVAVVSAAVSTALSAQVGPALDPGVMVGYAGGEANRYSLERNSANRAAQSARQAPSLRALNRAAFTARAATSRVAANTKYVPSAAVTQRNAKHFVDRTRAADPSAGADLERSMRGGALIADARRALPAYALDPNDVADASAAYLVTAWYAARGSDQDPSRAMLRSVSNQFAAAMAADPLFRQADDAVKQQLAEAMIVHTIYASAAMRQARGNPDMLRRVSQGIAAGAQNTFGFAMQSIDLTDQGLRMR